VSFGFPVEPFCYLEVTFPKELLLRVKSIKGSGVFQPFYERSELTVGGMYQTTGQTLKVGGCRLQGFLSEAPYGTLFLDSIQMPDYIQEVGSIGVKLFADDEASSPVATGQI
jgi:hypothetical protein